MTQICTQEFLRGHKRLTIQQSTQPYKRLLSHCVNYRKLTNPGLIAFSL